MFDEQPSRVSISRCESYSMDILQSTLKQLLQPLGGMEKWVKPGMKVLLKPNLLSARSPDAAVTTHPELVAAIAREVRAQGGEVAVGDSPGGGVREISDVWEKTGLAEIAARENLRLANFEGAGVVRYPVNGRDYYISRPVVEADLIINIPKLKTHVLTMLSGAVKNMFGIVPGFRKANYHKEAPTPDAFAQILVDILSLRPPDLNIMDAVLAMEGEGPSSGTPRWMNLLLASSDPVAIDAIAACIIGIRADDIPTTKIASESGLGIGWPEAIEVVGTRLQDALCPDFRLTSNRKMKLIPAPISRFLGRYIWIRPAINTANCSQCYLCVDACPTGALSSTPTEYPAIDYEKCINCWCCHESCPSKAVEIEQSWLAERFIK